MALAVCDWQVKALLVKKYWRVAQQVEREIINLVVVQADVPDINVGDIQRKKQKDRRRIKK